MSKKEVLEVEIVKEKKTRVRLTDDKWLEMKMEWCFKGTSHRELATKYGTSKSTVESRCRKEKWALWKSQNKLDRSKAVLAYSTETVTTYLQMISLLKNDLKEWSDMEWKDKKMFIECYKLADVEVARHLMLQGDD